MNISAKFQLHPPYMASEEMIRKFILSVATATKGIQWFGQN